jgi:hypothetical protein
MYQVRTILQSISHFPFNGFNTIERFAKSLSTKDFNPRLVIGTLAVTCLAVILMKNRKFRTVCSRSFHTIKTKATHLFHRAHQPQPQNLAVNPAHQPQPQNRPNLSDYSMFSRMRDRDYRVQMLNDEEFISQHTDEDIMNYLKASTQDVLCDMTTLTSGRFYKLLNQYIVSELSDTSGEYMTPFWCYGNNEAIYSACLAQFPEYFDFNADLDHRGIIRLIKYNHITEVERIIESHPSINLYVYDVLFTAAAYNRDFLKRLLPKVDLESIYRFINQGIQYLRLPNDRYYEVINILLSDPRVDPSLYDNKILMCAIQDQKIDLIYILLNDERVVSKLTPEEKLEIADLKQKIA